MNQIDQYNNLLFWVDKLSRELPQIKAGNLFYGKKLNITTKDKAIKEKDLANGIFKIITETHLLMIDSKCNLAFANALSTYFSGTRHSTIAGQTVEKLLDKIKKCSKQLTSHAESPFNDVTTPFLGMDPLIEVNYMINRPTHEKTEKDYLLLLGFANEMWLMQQIQNTFFDFCSLREKTQSILQEHPDIQISPVQIDNQAGVLIQVNSYQEIREDSDPEDVALVLSLNYATQSGNPDFSSDSLQKIFQRKHLSKDPQALMYYEKYLIVYQIHQFAIFFRERFTKFRQMNELPSNVSLAEKEQHRMIELISLLFRLSTHFTAFIARSEKEPDSISLFTASSDYQPIYQQRKAWQADNWEYLLHWYKEVYQAAERYAEKNRKVHSLQPPISFSRELNRKCPVEILFQEVENRIKKYEQEALAGLSIVESRPPMETIESGSQKKKTPPPIPRWISRENLLKTAPWPCDPRITHWFDEKNTPLNQPPYSLLSDRGLKIAEFKHRFAWIANAILEAKGLWHLYHEEDKPAAPSLVIPVIVEAPFWERKQLFIATLAFYENQKKQKTLYHRFITEKEHSLDQVVQEMVHNTLQLMQQSPAWLNSIGTIPSSFQEEVSMPDGSCVVSQTDNRITVRDPLFDATLHFVTLVDTRNQPKKFQWQPKKLY